MPTLTDDQWERTKLVLDQLDNLTTGLTVMTALPDHIHITALRQSLPDAVKDLRAVVDEVEPE